MWVASEAGIMSIDLLHENLNFYKEYSGKNNNVLYSPVQALLVDDFNNLWVGKSDGLAYIILDDKRYPDIEKRRGYQNHCKTWK